MSRPTRNMPLDVVHTLIAIKVPMALKTTYQDGKPASWAWTTCRCTKPDRFFRINGRVVSRNIAVWAMRGGACAVRAEA